MNADELGINDLYDVFIVLKKTGISLESYN